MNHSRFEDFVLHFKNVPLKTVCHFKTLPADAFHLTSMFLVVFDPELFPQIITIYFTPFVAFNILTKVSWWLIIFVCIELICCMVSQHITVIAKELKIFALLFVCLYIQAAPLHSDSRWRGPPCWYVGSAGVWNHSPILNLNLPFISYMMNGRLSIYLFMQFYVAIHAALHMAC